MWRGRFISGENYDEILSQRRGSLVYLKKNQIALRFMVGKSYYLHRGNRYIRKSIAIADVGYSLGAFISTREKHIYKKKKNKKKKKANNGCNYKSPKITCR